MEFESKAIHAGSRPDPLYGAVSVPIYQTSNFVFEDMGKSKGFEYTRSANPTRKVLEDTLAALEGGEKAFVFASGMAAETTIFHLLRPGDHVVAQQDLYGGTYRLLTGVMAHFGIAVTFVDAGDISAFEKAILPNTKMIWLESISNPLLHVADFRPIVDLGHARGALTVMDNTFASPYFFNPLSIGVDIVLHSTTKYINGHCDVIGGAVVVRDQTLGETIGYLANALGTAQAPFDAWLVLRGVETLAVRMQRHEQNALAVARFLEQHPKVKKVYYPGLGSHHSHETAKRYLNGFGGVVSFEIAGGIEAAHAFFKRLKIFGFAESLGGLSSLCQHPATMSHAAMPEEYRKTLGICDDLIRLSIGLEHEKDLLRDLEEGLA